MTHRCRGGANAPAERLREGDDARAVWHLPRVTTIMQAQRLTPKLVSTLYTEAMLLADDTRAYFDQRGRDDRDALDPLQRVMFSCESLKVTTRLMHVIAWLLTHRAVENGEIAPARGDDADRRLGHASDSAEDSLTGLPTGARTLIVASADLYGRARRIDDELARGSEPAQGARELQERLGRSF